MVKPRVKNRDLRSVLEKMQDNGEQTPLDYLLEVMRNKDLVASIRLEAAKSAAPYVHRKQPLDVHNTGEVKIIPPFVPSKAELQRDYADELSEDL